MMPATPKRGALLWGEARESFVMAMAALGSHKLRSALTLLGVMVGVFSIIMVMTAMRALQNNIETEMTGLGASTFMVEKWPAINAEGPRGWEKFRRRKNITLAQATALRERATLAVSVGAEAFLWNAEVVSRFETTNPDVGMIGVTPEVFGAKKWIIEEGRAIQQGDVDGLRAVCVLGNALAKKLFPQGSPVGESIKFNGHRYSVVGLLEAKGGMGGQSQDNFIAVPLTTGFGRFGFQPWRSLSLFVEAPSPAMLEDTAEQVRGVMRTLRKVPPGEEDDFEMFSNDSLVEQFRDLTFAVRMGVAVVSSIALIAAGIGIMNIMLVSVTERTREIGVRRAVGAKKRNIMTQFIMEAVVICQVGGVIGVALGIAGGNAAVLVLKTAPVFPLDWAIIGLLICSVVGIVFGTYPAWRAANLDPVESLRYE
ncbi:MAG: FtsX-like permease family protein [Verrucomicrobia bacterium]|nr:FtsX-like permease family protein [Verrucomicrobiota bacterium]